MAADANANQNIADLAQVISSKLSTDEIGRLAEILTDIPSACALREILAPLPAGSWGSGAYPGTPES